MNSLNVILDRIATGNYTPEDIQLLRHNLIIGGKSSIVQMGNYNIAVGDINQARDIHIGNRIYQGSEAETIRQVLQQVIAEYNHQLSREKSLNRREFRNRRDLLLRIKNEINGRLEQALHRQILLNLNKEYQSDQVQRLWDVEVKIGNQPSIQLLPTLNITDIFDQETIAGRLLILGAPGSGKTTTLLELGRELIDRAEQHVGQPIPVLLNLSSWKDKRKSIAQWLITEIKSRYRFLSNDLIKQWLKERQIIPLLDGLDELEPSRQDRCAQAINQFLDNELQSTYVVVCSRLEEYKSYNTLLELNGAICLQPLTDTQIRAYLQDVGMPNLWSFLQQDAKILDLVRIPLFLSLITSVNQNHDLLNFTAQSHSVASLNDYRRYLFDAYVESMFRRTTKSQSYSRSKLPKAEDSKRWLSWLAVMLRVHFQTEFSPAEIQPTWLQNVSQKRTYFKIGAMLGAVLNFLCFLIFSEFYNPIQLFQNILNSALWAIPLKFCLVILIAFLPGYAIGWLVFEAESKNKFTKIEVVKSLNQDPKFWWIQGVIAVIFSLLIGILFSGPFWVLGIWLKVKFISEMSILYLTIAAMSGAISAFYIFLLSFQYLCIYLILVSRGNIPWNYRKFLDFATEHMLLQKVGKRYRFIHDLLREHFVSQYPIEQLDTDSRSRLALKYGWRCVGILREHKTAVSQVIISPDNKKIVSGTEDSMIYIWETNSGNLLYTLEAHSGRVNALAITPNSNLLVSGDADGTLNFWSLKKGVLLDSLTVHTGAITTIAISPNGQLLATGGEDNCILIWSLKNKELQHIIVNVAEEIGDHASLCGISALAFSQDNRTLAAGLFYDDLFHTEEYGESRPIIKVWQTKNWQPLVTFQKRITYSSSDCEIYSLAFKPDSQTLIGIKDGAITSWNLDNPELHYSSFSFYEDMRDKLSNKLLEEILQSTITSACLGSDGHSFLIATKQGNLYLLDLEINSLVETLLGHKSAVTSLSLSQDRSILVSGSQDNTVRIWHPAVR